MVLEQRTAGGAGCEDGHMLSLCYHLERLREVGVRNFLKCLPHWWHVW